MSNYTKTTNFAVKDTLPSGDTNKIVKGTEIDAEFNALAVASATKANKTNPSFTGEITIGSASVNETELEILDGATVTTTELNYVDGVTSSIQTQIDTKLNSSTVSAFGATLIDDADAPAARTTLGLGTAATTASTDYATAAQGTTADAALPLAGGALTGAVTTNSTFDGVDIATRDGVLTTTTTTANAALPKSGGAMTGAITTNSTFDGRDVATDGTKLDGIEASADVTDTTNVVASLTAGSNITIAADGTIASTASGGGNETLQETLAIGNTTTTDTKIQFRDTGLYINSSADGQLDIVADTEVQIAATTVDVNGILDVSGNIVAGGTVDGRDVATDGTKLDGIEASADVTDATNVTAAGALMDSEVTNLAQVKAFDSSDYATATQGTTADAALPKAGGTVTGTVVFEAAITEDAVTLTGTTTTIDLATATNFVHDLTGATTYTFSNPATTGNATAFTLKIIQDSTARAITWPASVDWAGGTAPTLTATDNGVDVFVFYTIDGGTTYYGFTAGQAMA